MCLIKIIEGNDKNAIKRVKMLGRRIMDDMYFFLRDYPKWKRRPIPVESPVVHLVFQFPIILHTEDILEEPSQTELLTALLVNILSPAVKVPSLLLIKQFNIIKTIDVNLFIFFLFFVFRKYIFY